MVSRIADGPQASSIAERLRSWPRTIHVADMFSGAGTFHKVMEAILRALKMKFASSMKDVEAHFPALRVGSGIVSLIEY